MTSTSQAADDRVNILLVDDQPANLLALEAVLEILGQGLVKAHSGREALRCLLDDDFAVVLLDVKMQDMDGFETAQLIRSRERSRSTPIIFLTAYESTDFSVAKAYSLGAVDYLVKPIVPEILRAKVSGFVELFQKTQQLRRQTDELKRTAAELTRSNRELEQFAYVASHDLKEPLRKIRIWLQLLGQGRAGQLPPEAKQYLDFAVDAAGRMQALINDLLAYARLDSRGKSFEPADCGVAMDQAVLNLEVAIRESGAVLTRGSLPSVRADAGQLVQLFQNLLSNAVKFRKDQPTAVHVEATRKADHWLFSVRDNGIGIDPRYAERIFVIFERLHSHQTYPGTGIGLAICKKIVERHGGSIWVESQPGEGATFRFTLPALEEPGHG